MLFKYSALNKQGGEIEGTINALNKDVAIRSLQGRGLTITSIESSEKKSFFKREFIFFERVPLKDIVILSRQMSTLFVAHVSALRIFRMLASESENAILRKKLTEVADDVQGGMSISQSFAKHPNIFSDFYVNMVRAGEESGKLNETFNFLADYLDRSYELTIKTRNALIYPAFILSVFVIVMILLFTLVFPRLAEILIETGQEIPLFTRIIIGFSNFLVDYGIFFLILLIIGGFFFARFARTKVGKITISRMVFSTPLLGKLSKRFYLARTADVLHTMLAGGIPVVRALEITSAVVSNVIFKEILQNAAQDVRAGSSISASFSHASEMPGIMVQIIKIGEETGELSTILGTLAKFYEREVRTAVDAMVGLIEPIIIVALGVTVGFVLASVLLPMYNISTGI